jgi:hypothetical protein
MVLHMNEPASEDASSTRTPDRRVDVRGPDEQSARIQLAARWAEMFGPSAGADERGTRERFRIALEYLDAVTHGIEPPRS